MKEVLPEKPFLWNYIKNVKPTLDNSGGEERIITESLGEENKIQFIETISV